MNKKTTLAEVAREIHENAKAHGWWDEEREPAEIYALIHSEWSEALEEYRAGRPDRWFYCIVEEHVGMCPNEACPLTPDVPCLKREPKPEGICVELMDGVIRIFDYLGKAGGAEEYNEEAADWYFEMIGEEGAAWTREVQELAVPALVNRLHEETCDARKRYRTGDGAENDCLMEVVTIVWQWIKGRGLDPMELLIEKHEYNKTRPYKHGKVC